MLGGLGFQFSGGFNIWQPGNVDVERIITPKITTKLAEGFQEWQAFNVSHGTAHFNQHNFSPGGFCNSGNPAFDFIGNMWNDLNGATKKITMAFLGYYFRIHLSGGDIADAI